MGREANGGNHSKRLWINRRVLGVGKILILGEAGIGGKAQEKRILPREEES